MSGDQDKSEESSDRSHGYGRNHWNAEVWIGIFFFFNSLKFLWALFELIFFFFWQQQSDFRHEEWQNVDSRPPRRDQVNIFFFSFLVLIFSSFSLASI